MLKGNSAGSLKAVVAGSKVDFALVEASKGKGKERHVATSTTIGIQEPTRDTIRPAIDPGQRPRTGPSAMNWVALRMLTGDRAKYLALIFAISFSAFLITQQASIFGGIMNRTRSQIVDVTDADIWVMDPATQYIDEVYALKDSA